ncbi:hypothetical protein PybrP1_008886, partial [[Pythium] brassicae (nom. inval.)]
VELHGQYSFERLRRLDTFAKTTSNGRVLVLCLLLPFPCLVLITLIDAVPLDNPNKGTNANYVHWLRNYLMVFLTSYAMLAQFPLSVPGLSLGPGRLLFTSLFASVGGVGSQFLMSHVIGFPVPFSLSFGAPLWFTSICITFAYYFGSLLRANSQFRTALKNYFVVFVAQVSLTFIYPAYIYGFQSISPAAQNVYVVLLPVIKIVLKNWMAMYLGKMDDMKPEIVIFNVEIFNALYVACSMQTATSISTTLVLSFVDGCQAWLSIRDIGVMLDEIKCFMDAIPPGHPWEAKNFLEVALAIIDEDERVRNPSPLRQQCGVHSEQVDSRIDNTQNARRLLNYYKPNAIVPEAPRRETLQTVNAAPAAAVASNISANTPASEIREGTAPVISRTSATSAPTAADVALVRGAKRDHFVLLASHLLYTTEFVLLVEYTEVIVPIIYSVYIVAAYNLPNREFYSQLAKMDTSDLERTVTNVFVYASFELVSFLVMSYILKKKLRVESLKQLAFVLDNQWAMVQSKLVLWFFYIVQNSLTHFGADFSFRFAWLHSKSPAPTT